MNGLEAILQNKASSENMGEVLEMHNKNSATKLQSSFRGMKSRAAYKKKKKKEEERRREEATATMQSA